MIAKRNATKGRKLRRSSLAQFFSVFGTPLKKVLLRENRQTHGVPIVVEKCVAAIRAQGAICRQRHGQGRREAEQGARERPANSMARGGAVRPDR